MNRLCAGLVGGLIATVPMTVVMELLHRWPYPERDSLPPHQITKRIAGRIGAEKHLDHRQIEAVTIANHFAFGATMGGLYQLLFARVPVHLALKGTVWGLCVWALSYLGWLPAAHILSSATRHSDRRNVLMIVAHLVWGISMALSSEKMADRRR